MTTKSSFLIVILAAVGLGGALTLAGVPASWLVGPLLAALLLRTVAGTGARIPDRLFMVAQALLGTTLGTTLRPESGAAVLSHWPLVLSAVVVVIGLGLLGGWILMRRLSLSSLDAFLGSIPGGAANMVIMSDELGGDSGRVALMQYIRLLVVILSAPLLAQFFPAPDGTAATGGGRDVAGAPALDTPVATEQALLYLTTTAAALLLGWAGRRSPLPVGALLLPAAVSGGLTMSGVLPVALPPGFLPAAFLVIGVRAGGGISRKLLRQAGQLIPAVIVFSAALSASCAFLAYVLSSLTEVDLLSAYLATTPGGMDSMIAAALDLGAETTFVLAVQLVRLVVILFAGPIVARILSRSRSRAGE